MRFIMYDVRCAGRAGVLILVVYRIEIMVRHQILILSRDDIKLVKKLIIIQLA